MKISKKPVEIEYKNKIYRRRTDKWFDTDNMIVCQSLQNELNRFYSASADLRKMSLYEILSEADRFKESKSYGHALEYYEYILTFCDAETAEYVLPRITSCYRKQGRARDAVKAFSAAKKKYGKDFFSAPLLTSVAAAYCDLEEYEDAKKCCDLANRLGGSSEMLKNVYRRIKANTED